MSVRPGSLHLDRENGRFLGVCAGLANWLDVPTIVVRIVFIICVLSWPTLIIGYFILYLCLDKDLTPDKMKDYFANASTAEHFRQLNYRKPIYKNSRNKRIAGVCAGIADYLEVSTFSVRLVALISLFVFGPFTFWAYVICAFAFDPDPYAEPSDRSTRREARRQAKRERREARHARYHRPPNSYVNEETDAQSGNGETASAGSQSRDFQSKGFKAEAKASSNSAQANSFGRAQCTEIFSDLEMRLREIEAYMTSKRFRLHCEINRI